MLTCWATDTVKVVLKSSHSRMADGLNHIVSTVPKVSLRVHLSAQACQPLQQSYSVLGSTQHRAGLGRSTTSTDWTELLSSTQEEKANDWLTRRWKRDAEIKGKEWHTCKERRGFSQFHCLPRAQEARLSTVSCSLYAEMCGETKKSALVPDKAWYEAQLSSSQDVAVGSSLGFRPFIYKTITTEQICCGDERGILHNGIAWHAVKCSINDTLG